jgi:hypothetical protein
MIYFLSPVHTGSVARRELLKSKLPSAELGKIWRLADTDRKVPCLQLMDSAAMICSSVSRYITDITLYNVEGEGPSRSLLSH